jgi:hypothetical protein
MSLDRNKYRNTEKNENKHRKRIMCLGLRQEDHKFKASLSYEVRHCLKRRILKIYQ